MTATLVKVSLQDSMPNTRALIEELGRRGWKNVARTPFSQLYRELVAELGPLVSEDTDLEAGSATFLKALQERPK